MSSQRLFLRVSAWSPQDQAALRMATTPGLRRARAGRAARWRPATVRIMTEGVGSFLGFLALSGVAAAEAGLSALCTEASVLDWITALIERRLTAYTIRFRVTGLQRGCEVMYPFSDWRWLKEIVADLPDGRQESRRRKMHQIRHSRELLELGVRLITSALSGRYLRPHLRHVVARDGMMIALLASRPLRLKNFTDLRLGRHLIRQEDGRWRLLVPASETKNGQSIEDILPEDIGRLLDRYLAIDRPVLLACGPTTAGAQEDHLWISEDGLPMTSTNVRNRITLETFKAFGVAISPHRFRDAGATTIALEMPAQMDMALALLGDRDPNTIAEHYNMATTLQASLKLAESLEAMMRELGVRSRLD
jgi:integrase